MKRVDATDVRRKFAEVADRVRLTGERVIVQRNGRALVAIVTIEDAERLEDDRRGSARSAPDRASLDRLLRRAAAVPILDARPADELLGYDSDGLPT
jgi:prevent-host-death family protein